MGRRISTIRPAPMRTDPSLSSTRLDSHRHTASRGQYQQASQYQQGANPVDTGSIGWAVLGFFVPIVGLVLWLVWKDQRPNDSRMSRNGFLAALIVFVVLMIIWFIIVAIVAASASMSVS